MNDFLVYQRRVLMLMISLAVVAVIVVAFCWPHPAYASGVALGALAAIVKFRLRVGALLRFAQTEGKEGARPQVGGAFQSYAIMAAALVLSLVLYDRYTLCYPWATFGGLLLPNLVLIADGLLRPGLQLGTPASQDGEAAHDA